MEDEVLIVACHRPKEEGAPYEIVFGNGDILFVTEAEVFENWLYREGEPCRNYGNMCTMILVKRMMASAASYVLFSQKSEQQVRTRLKESFSGAEHAGWARYMDAALEEAIRRLNEIGYLDDLSYCRKYIASALRGKPVSRAGLLNNLIYKKEIPRALAEREVAAAYAKLEDSAEDDNAYRLLQKRTGGRIPYNQKELAKLYRYMKGKGFTTQSIETGLRRMKEEGRGRNG